MRRRSRSHRRYCLRRFPYSWGIGHKKPARIQGYRRFSHPGNARLSRRSAQSKSCRCLEIRSSGTLDEFGQSEWHSSKSARRASGRQCRQIEQDAIFGQAPGRTTNETSPVEKITHFGWKRRDPIFPLFDKQRKRQGNCRTLPAHHASAAQGDFWCVSADFQLSPGRAAVSVRTPRRAGRECRTFRQLSESSTVCPDLVCSAQELN